MSTKISASGETDKSRKREGGMNAVAGTMQTPALNQGEEVNESNA